MIVDPPTPTSAPSRAPVPPVGGAPGRSVVVSVHDVSPLTFETCRAMLEKLDALGCRGHLSLLVIANHHSKGEMLDDPDFCHWMKEREALGDEIVIHGYRHARAPRPGETLKEKITTRLYTAGEGEFFDMNGSDALWQVNEARLLFRKIGLDPRGFIAPAWLLSEPAQQALTKLGFLYTTRLGEVIDLACERVYPSQSLVWSVRSLWRRVVSRWWNAYLFRRMQPEPLLRIGLHPVDLDHPRIWRQIETLIARALEDRQPVTYLRWIEAIRST